MTIFPNYATRTKQFRNTNEAKVVIFKNNADKAIVNKCQCLIMEQ